MHARGVYSDRSDAGRWLAETLLAVPALANPPSGKPIVLGLPRGGVPVAAEVARALDAPLDVVIARKLGVPGSPEVAMGAIASVGGELAVVWNVELRELVVAREGADGWRRVLEHETRELERRSTSYRGDRPPLALEGRTVLLVDDGIATGATMRAAAVAVRGLRPERLVAATPIALLHAEPALEASVDDIVCPWFSANFMGVGQAYADFTQTSDDEVRRLLGSSV